MHVKIEGHPPNLHRIHNQSEKNDTLHYVRHFKIQMTKISFLSRFINTRLQHLMVNHRGCFHFSEKWHKHITHRISRRNIPTDDLLCVAKPIPQNITEEVRLLNLLINFPPNHFQPSHVYLFSFEQQQVDKLWETL